MTEAVTSARKGNKENSGVGRKGGGGVYLKTMVKLLLTRFPMLYKASFPLPRSFQMAASPGLNSAFGAFCLANICNIFSKVI